jgi:hypothetical protein
VRISETNALVGFNFNFTADLCTVGIEISMIYKGIIKTKEI